jgi:hypothetical protein
MPAKPYNMRPSIASAHKPCTPRTGRAAAALAAPRQLRRGAATDPGRVSLDHPSSVISNFRADFAMLAKVAGRTDLPERAHMEVRYYLDPDTGQPHIYGHGVTEQEVEQVLRGRGEDLRATGNSRRKIGETSDGRYLQVFYVPDEDPDSVFVITAYEPQGKAKQAFRRRQRRKPK